MNGHKFYAKDREGALKVLERALCGRATPRLEKRNGQHKLLIAVAFCREP